MALAFFDERMSPADWSAMVKNLSIPTTSKALERLEKNFTFPEGLLELVTKQTLEALGSLLRRWLLSRKWNMFCKIHKLKSPSEACRSPNNAAERGVALIQRLHARTKNEDQKQFLFKVVHYDHKTVKRTKAGVTAKLPLAP